MYYAPIIVTVYDRLEHFRQCIESLKCNSPATESELYVVSDAPAKPAHAPRIEHVRDYARAITGFKGVHLIFREENYGAHRSFLAITKQVLDAHERFIFLEDDVVVSSNFLAYMNGGLNFYEKDPRIFSISAYTHPMRLPKHFSADVFALPSNCPWGFATWKNRWDQVDFGNKDRFALAMRDRQLLKKLISTGTYMINVMQSDSMGRIQAPDVRVAFHQFERDIYTIFPRISKTRNIGLDGSGLHSSKDVNQKYHVQLDTTGSDIVYEENIRLNPAIIRCLRRFQNGSFFQSLAGRMRLLKKQIIYRLGEKYTSL